MAYYVIGGYHHDIDDFGDKIEQHDAGLTAHIAAIVHEAGAIAFATAPELTGEFKTSFTTSTLIEDHKGLRVVGVLESTDPDAAAKEFGQKDGHRTMNDAMRKAIG